MFRKENGVTLVALVITIIVLLILAGVTITMVLDKDGIIAQASGATIAQKEAAIRDHVAMALADARMEDVAYAAGVGGATDPKTNEIETRVKTYLGTVGYKAANVDADTADTVKIIEQDGQGAAYTITVEIETGSNGNYAIKSITNAAGGTYTK